METNLVTPLVLQAMLDSALGVRTHVLNKLGHQAAHIALLEDASLAADFSYLVEAAELRRPFFLETLQTLLIAELVVQSAQPVLKSLRMCSRA